MNFIKWYVDRHGVLLGVGSLLIVALSFVGLAVVTKGMILVLIPLGIFWYVVMEIIQYCFRGDSNR